METGFCGHGVEHMETSESEGVATVVESARVMISDWQQANPSSPNVLSAATVGSRASQRCSNHLIRC
jgi:hypothetical protein